MLNALSWNLILTAGLAVLLFGACRVQWLHRRPALRCWLWVLLFVKLITPPLIDVPMLPALAQADAPVVTETAADTAEHKAVETPAAGTGLEDFSKRAMEMEKNFLSDGENDGTVSPETDEAGEAGVVAEEISAEAEAAAQVPFWTILLGISLVGTGAFWAVYGWGTVHVHRRLRRLGQEDDGLTAVCETVASALKLRRAPRGLVVRSRTTPLLWTPLLWVRDRATVAMPSRLMEAIEPDQLQQIVAHEMAHFLRGDHWVNLFVFLVKSLMWWNPIVWWADRELRAAQELCCDAIAIDCCRATRRGYATTLLQALDFIQTKPKLYSLALEMGSKRSILRRFEMIGETRLTYRVSRWAFLAFLILMVPLVCMPVRGEEKAKASDEQPAVTVINETEEEVEKSRKAEMAEILSLSDAFSHEVVEEGKSIHQKTRELGEAVKKRITTYTDEATLTLKDGETGRMRVKKNLSPVVEIRVTPHLVDKGSKSAKSGSASIGFVTGNIALANGSNANSGTQFELVGVDAKGKVIPEMKSISPVIADGQDLRMNLGPDFMVDGKSILSKVQLTPKRSDDKKTVTVTVKALFTESPTLDEYGAMILLEGKDKKFEFDTRGLFEWIFQQAHMTGQYPKSLGTFEQTIPKDIYSPRGENYHYEVDKNRIILSSCGEDGIYGNKDDMIFVYGRNKTKVGQRHELYPLDEKFDDGKEIVTGKRPDGTCSIRGKVVDAKTGKPIANAALQLFYHSRDGGVISIVTAEDGTFAFEKIATGPYRLSAIMVPGYQHHYYYNPEKNTDMSFSLVKGEQRDGLVLKLKKAYYLSGKVVDAEGNVPKMTGNNRLVAVAWYKEEGSEVPQMRQGMVNPKDGSYRIGYLDDEPVYVSIIQLDISRKGAERNYPAIHYPGTLFREEAKPITLNGSSAKNINITIPKGKGLVVEGTVRDEQGKPVPETQIGVRGLVTVLNTYTDKDGKYRLECLDSGETTLHADAVHRGFMAARKTVTLDRKHPTTTQDFTLKRGVSISGKFVDEAGKPWKLGREQSSESSGSAVLWSMSTGKPYDTESAGYASIVGETADASTKSLWMSGNGNRYNRLSFPFPETFGPGTEKHPYGMMYFPTETTFRILATTPGQTKIKFAPNKEGQVLKKILYKGKDVTTTGLKTRPGETIEDVTIVIGKGKTDGKKEDLYLYHGGGAFTATYRMTGTLHVVEGEEKKEEKKEKEEKEPKKKEGMGVLVPADEVIIEPKEDPMKAEGMGVLVPSGRIQIVPGKKPETEKKEEK